VAAALAASRDRRSDPPGGRLDVPPSDDLKKGSHHRIAASCHSHGHRPRPGLIAASRSGADFILREKEEHVYYRDLSEEVITNDTISRLLTYPNVLITGHKAFFTREAMRTISETTI
jgi:hypothetical protein